MFFGLNGLNRLVQNTCPASAAGTAVGIEAVQTPAGGEPVSVRVIAERPDTIVGFGHTRIYTEPATFRAAGERGR